MSFTEPPVAGQPSGTVTLAFTDIEGSTRLLQALGDRYPEVLADHHRLIREAFARHGAVERGSAGDGLYFVFPAARGAVQAAIDGQLAVAGHAWPDGAAVRDRMGLHTGEPWNAAEGYVGLDVHRAARICAAGHGGQILISQTTRDLSAEELRPPLGVVDLGAHRLRSLDGPPQRLYQVTGPGLADDFPPPRTGEAPRNNLDARGHELHRPRARDRAGEPDPRAVVAPDPHRARAAWARRGSACDWLARCSTGSRTGPGSSSAAMLTDPAFVLPVGRRARSA